MNTKITYFYCITHIPSGMRYIGKYSKNPQIRFIEHMCGYGSIAIWELICNGASIADFELEILEQTENRDQSFITKREYFYVEQYCTSFPYGLNFGYNISCYKKYQQLKKEYSDLGWCIKLLDEFLLNEWKLPVTTIIQNKIENISKYQNLSIKFLSLEEMETWRIYKRRGYNAKNTFINKDMSKFFANREIQYERMRNKNFTEKEKAAQATRSSSMKKVWANRTEEEKQVILKSATLKAAESNRKIK